MIRHSPASSSAGGYKSSGVGRDKGEYALEHYTQVGVGGCALVVAVGGWGRWVGRAPAADTLHAVRRRTRHSPAPPHLLTPHCRPITDQGRVPEPGAQPALAVSCLRPKSPGPGWPNGC